MTMTDAVSTPIKLLTRELLDTLQATAAQSPRRRANHNLHPELEDPVQRFFNAMALDTYVRPHRHRTPPRWELFLVLQGDVAVLTFDDQGRVTGRTELQAGGPVFGIELPEGQWHALVALEPASLFELKPGPYNSVTDKDFAQWAPAEGQQPDCTNFVQWYRGAEPGQLAPPLSGA